MKNLSTTLAATLGCVILALVMVTTIQAQLGGVVSLGSATAKGADGKARGATSVEGSIGEDINGNSTGNLIFRFRNDVKDVNGAGADIDDIHVRNLEFWDPARKTWRKPYHKDHAVTGHEYVITGISTTAKGGEPTEGEMSGSPTADGQGADAACSGNNVLSAGNTLTVVLAIRDNSVQPPALPPKGAKFRFELTPTLKTEVVCNTATNGIGSGRPRTAVASLGIVGLHTGPISVTADPSETWELNDLCLAECDGYRFRRGSLVLTPTRGTRFVMDEDTRVLVYNEMGDESDLVIIAEKRIDDRGNFVFDLHRSADEHHVVLVIRGLKLKGVGLPGDADPVDPDIYCTASGAAISGAVLTNMWKIASFDN
jgi:hypothetical protein